MASTGRFWAVNTNPALVDGNANTSFDNAPIYQVEDGFSVHQGQNVWPNGNRHAFNRGLGVGHFRGMANRGRLMGVSGGARMFGGRGRGRGYGNVNDAGFRNGPGGNMMRTVDHNSDQYLPSWLTAEPPDPRTIQHFFGPEGQQRWRAFLLQLPQEHRPAARLRARQIRQHHWLTSGHQDIVPTEVRAIHALSSIQT